MFKKRHSTSHISPLPSPASTNPNGAGPYGQHQYNQEPPAFQRPPQGNTNGGGRMSVQMPQPYRQSSSNSSVSSPYADSGSAQGSVRNRQSMQPPRDGGEVEELRAGPPYGSNGNGNGHPQGHGQGQGYQGGPPVDRVSSESQQSSKGSEKEKRRSFFGFGRKKEDKKDKEREEREKLEARTPRQSFNVTRTESNHAQAAPGGQGFPQQMHRFPTPGSGGPSPPPPPGQQNRIASNPSARPGGDFGPGGGVPKSQSMGFAQQQNRVPDTHPYRGYLAGHPEQQQLQVHGQGVPQGLPKSTSMPFNKSTPPTPNPDQSPVPSSQARGSPLAPTPSNDNANAEQPTRERLLSAGSGRASLGDQPEWMREFAGIVELIGMQPQKTYVASPPELEMILARTSAGGQPKQGAPGSVSNDWDAVWLQLSGISMSMWSMKETRAAAAKGDKVPPTYFNVTDSSLELLAPLPPPPHRPKSHPHRHVFSLNTAGSNRLLFSCPSEPDIARWATGLRLAAWERARLEEIYTGHLIKSGGKEPRMDLQKGRMEGWVRVRIMGGTEWKRLYAVLYTPNPPPEPEEDKKTRRRSFFGMGGSGSGGKDEAEVIQEPNTGHPMASFYPEPRTPKNRSMAPILTIANVTQAYAVFPERLEVMSQSNLMKVVGKISGELVAIESRLRDSGWVLIMPDAAEAGAGHAGEPAPTPLVNMMKWVTGVHDVFGLYGRPGRYSWDEKDPRSLFFAYPKGPERNRLFLEIDNALDADYRLSNLPQIRSQFTAILSKKGLPRSNSNAQVPPRQGQAQPERMYADDSDLTPPARPGSNDYRLPPLSFDQAGSNTSPHLSQHSIPRSLSPITERTDPSRNNSQRTAGTADRQASGSSAKHAQQGSGSSKYLSTAQEEGGLETITDTSSLAGMTDEPRQATPNTFGGAVNTSPESKAAQTQSTMDSRAGSESVYSQNTGVTATPTRSATTSPKVSPPGPSALAVSAVAVPAVLAGAHSAAVNTGTSTPTNPPLAPPIGMGRPLASGPASISGDSERSIHSPTPRRVASTEFKQDKLVVHDEQPTAQYLMHVVEGPTSHTPPPPTATPGSDKERLRPTIVTDFSTPKPIAPTLTGSSATGGKMAESVTRKPSGARAPPPKKLSGRSNSSRLGSVDDVEPAAVGAPPVPAGPGGHAKERSGTVGTFEDIGEDASAYLAYADQPLSATYKPESNVPLAPKMAEEDAHRSSFAPSKAAVDRRAKAEAAAEEAQRSKNVPGGGKRGVSGAGQGAAGQTWSDDEDDEDEDEDEGDSPVVARNGTAVEQGVDRESLQRGQQDQHGGNMGSIGRGSLRALPPVPIPRQQEERQSQQQRPSSNHMGGEDYPQPVYPERPRTRSPAQPQYSQQQPQQRGPSQPYGLPASAPSGAIPNMAPPAARQSIWNANFSAEHGMPTSTSTNKFVDLDEPQAKLIQAFAPHGLLQAGMQDKEDRSAKKQEELAREMGSSLVNVPSKPPPPSAGLLGAVAQHEKERKNAGGIGATLTDREREKRLAEDRQREIEKLQRQQAEHMRQFAEFQGGQQGQGQGYGGYGMGMPPMGMGMGMPMGYNPYQGGFNPYAQQQAMYAAQMAYQNAMMMSAAGSQAGGHGGDDRPASPGGSQFGGYGGGGPPQMPWGMPMPWMSPQPTGSPMMGGMGGMGMGQFPSMHFGQGGPGSDHLHPGGGYGGGQSQQGGGSSGHATPAPPGEGRGRGDSFRNEGGQGGAPAS